MIALVVNVLFSFGPGLHCFVAARVVVANMVVGVAEVLLGLNLRVVIEFWIPFLCFIVIVLKSTKRLALWSI